METDAPEIVLTTGDEPELQPEPPPASAEPEPEAPAEPEPQASPPRAKREEHMVPLSVVEELRADRRSLTGAVQQIAQLVQAIAPASTPSQPDPGPMPPPQDPDKLGEWIVDSLERSLKFQQEYQQERQRIQASQEQERVFAQIRGHLEPKYNAFAAQNPDFWDAAKALGAEIKKARMEEGYSEQEAIQHVNDIELRIAAQAEQRGEDPALAIYRMSQKKAKFVPASVRAQREEEAKKRAAAEATGRGLGGDGSPVGDGRRALIEAFAKAPMGSPEREKIGKKLLTP
ncbi:MAG TPA: hypothetical protein DCY18_05480 [Thauera sp.]|nr:hypothetical protein [Thauera sp.]